MAVRIRFNPHSILFGGRRQPWFIGHVHAHSSWVGMLSPLPVVGYTATSHIWDPFTQSNCIVHHGFGRNCDRRLRLCNPQLDFAVFSFWSTREIRIEVDEVVPCWSMLYPSYPQLPQIPFSTSSSGRKLLEVPRPTKQQKLLQVPPRPKPTHKQETSRVLQNWETGIANHQPRDFGVPHLDPRGTLLSDNSICRVWCLWGICTSWLTHQNAPIRPTNTCEDFDIMIIENINGW